ncbi:hypothetical protein [Polymorphospora rubra]|uniref:hypothetical protein n=1 Tax=Polymorphospora rubra TaxID=338584 RepID=UPI001BB31DA1|nr:hypothetical protein [Polymorphospora rubra]
MSALTALARARAAATGTAQRITTVRHVHIADRPLVFVPLALAGEANAPLGCLVGPAYDEPTLLVVPQPRNRDQRFAFAESLAAVMLTYLDSFRGVAEAVPTDRGRDVRYRFVDAPQILVPNPAGIGFVRLLGRSTRFRRTDGDYPVPPAVPLLGRWMTFLADRAEMPGSSMLVAATDALSAHWATGQSALEDAHLGSLLGWISPPPGRTGAQAGRDAEDPAVCPPAGPATDPGFDNDVLAPLVRAIRDAEADGTDDGPARAVGLRATAELADALHGQLEPTWRAMWDAVTLLRELPPGARVAGRWADDRDAYSDYAVYVDGGHPQPRRDGAVAAAQRLHRLEKALTSYAVQRAYDDPLVMAEHRLTGEAFVGEVTLADAKRVDDSGKRPVLRPRIQLVTADPVRLTPGTVLISPARPAQKARVCFVTAAPGESKTEVVLELSGGMGRSRTAAPGSVPEVGERLCYTTITDGFSPPGTFPAREATPWTHGGPPVDGAVGDTGATEDWS